MPISVNSPVELLAECWHHALLIALPEMTEYITDGEALMALSAKERRAINNGDKDGPTKPWVRRPRAKDCQLKAMFPQTWGGRQLGFGGWGGAAVTTAYTVVVQGPDRHCAVYWNGRFGYLVDPTASTEEQYEAFLADVKRGWTRGQDEARERYGAVWPTTVADELLD